MFLDSHCLRVREESDEDEGLGRMRKAGASEHTIGILPNIRTPDGRAIVRRPALIHPRPTPLVSLNLPCSSRPWPLIPNASSPVSRSPRLPHEHSVYMPRRAFNSWVVGSSPWRGTGPKSTNDRGLRLFRQERLLWAWVMHWVRIGTVPVSVGCRFLPIRRTGSHLGVIARGMVVQSTR